VWFEQYAVVVLLVRPSVRLSHYRNFKHVYLLSLTSSPIVLDLDRLKLQHLTLTEDEITGMDIAGLDTD